MYLLDTNICVYAINGRYPELTRRLLAIPPDEILISAVTVGELEYGAAKSRWGTRTRQILGAFLASFQILSFDEDAAIAFGRIRSELEASGTMIGLLDAMIGAQGLAGGHTVVTHNTREFLRIPGIRLEDWAEQASPA